MAFAEQMRVELVHVVHLLATDVTLPRVALAVAALVQEVERLVRELDTAEQTLQVTLRFHRERQQQIRFLAGGSDGTV